MNTELATAASAGTFSVTSFSLGVAFSSLEDLLLVPRRVFLSYDLALTPEKPGLAHLFCSIKSSAETLSLKHFMICL